MKLKLIIFTKTRNISSINKDIFRIELLFIDLKKSIH
jgi:hypothetical protein